MKLITFILSIPLIVLFFPIWVLWKLSVINTGDWIENVIYNIGTVFFSVLLELLWFSYVIVPNLNKFYINFFNGG